MVLVVEDGEDAIEIIVRVASRCFHFRVSGVALGLGIISEPRETFLMRNL